MDSRSELEQARHVLGMGYTMTRLSRLLSNSSNNWLGERTVTRSIGET
jgi:hypothetical protein